MLLRQHCSQQAGLCLSHHAVLPQVRLPKCSVLVAGGSDTTGVYSSTVEVYNVASGMWQVTGQMLQPRRYHQLVRLRNGTVLAAGGFNGTSALNSAELYDPSTGKWTQATPMNHARYLFNMVLLGDGKVLAASGDDNITAGITTTTSEIFHPEKNTWTLVGPMQTGREYAQIALLPSGKALVAGGFNNTLGVLAQAEVFTPASASWAATGPLGAQRFNHQMVKLRGGGVLAAGGQDNAIPLKSAEIYSESTSMWASAKPMTDYRFLFKMVIL